LDNTLFWSKYEVAIIISYKNWGVGEEKRHRWGGCKEHQEKKFMSERYFGFRWGIHSRGSPHRSAELTAKPHTPRRVRKGKAQAQPSA